MTRESVDQRICRVIDLRRGDKVTNAVFLVEVSNFKQTRNQKYFLQMVLRDSTGSIKAVRWEATEDLYHSFAADDFLRVTGRVEEFQNHLQLVVDELERVLPDTVDFTRFLPASERDPDEMEAELRQTVAEMKNPMLRRLVLAVIDDPEVRPALRRCPAGKTLHHACVGGLLEHICSLLGASRAIAEIYPEVDRDMLYAASVLHDIGKLRELSYTSNFQYTDEGQLLGHCTLGMLLVERKAREIPDFPPDLLLRIQHIIASHHGLPEHGAVKLPMTAEAIAFHYLDTLDAKLGTLRSIAGEFPVGDEPRDPAAGKWSDFKPHLSRRIYFPAEDDG